MRWVVRLAVFAGLGLIVTIAVAWGCAVWSDLSEMDVSLSEFDGDIPWPDDGGGAHTGWRSPESSMSQRGFGLSRHEGQGWVPGSSAGDPAVPMVYVTAQAWRAGWPWASMGWGERVTSGLSGEEPGTYARRVWRGGLEPPRDLRRLGAEPGRRLPLTPVWAAFLMGAALYGGAGLLAWESIGWGTRAWRRRRGRCEGCGYPVGVSAVCTECGRSVGR